MLKLSRKFFINRNTRTVARELLGKVLVRKLPLEDTRGDYGGNKIFAIITETEAYCGPRDLASHASRGKTKRTEVMFGKPGLIYVYLIYGMHHCLNIVTEREDYPAAVLIRRAWPISSKSQIMSPRDISRRETNSKQYQNPKLQIPNSKLKANLNGPGKLCRYFQIDRSLNAKDTTSSRELWIEDWGIKIKPNLIKSAPRIGVDYAGKDKDKKWRYFVNI